MKKQTNDHPVTRDELAMMINNLDNKFAYRHEQLDKSLSQRQYEMELRLTKQQWDIYSKSIPIIMALQAGIMGLFKFFG